jgi:hypothetical protein
LPSESVVVSSKYPRETDRASKVMPSAGTPDNEVTVPNTLDKTQGMEFKNIQWVPELEHKPSCTGSVHK